MGEITSLTQKEEAEKLGKSVMNWQHKDYPYIQRSR